MAEISRSLITNQRNIFTATQSFQLPQYIFSTIII